MLDALELIFPCSSKAFLLELLINGRLANEISALTLVMMILDLKRCFMKSNKAFCIISVTSYPFNEGPIKTTGLIEGTTS